MSPRVAYWTSAFEAEMEAIAAEVHLLRRHFQSSVSWGLCHRRWAQCSWQRGFSLHPKLHLVFRAFTQFLEPLFEINHVVGSIGDWFYLVGRRTRPTVLTLAADEVPVDKPLLDRVDRFVVEHPGGRDELVHLGIEPHRVKVILPPVDLDRFHPADPPTGRFTVLFASSPDDRARLKARGVPLILDAAALQPHMQFRLLWRPWGDSLATVQRWINERELRNVRLDVGRLDNMAAAYQDAHVTLVPFTDRRFSKPAPNSLVESLACGRPVICSTAVGLGPLVEEAGAGRICDLSPQNLACQLDEVQSRWDSFSKRARWSAEKYFAASQFLAGYDRTYRELLDRRQ